MTGAQAVIRSLEELDVDVIFGIPGGAVLPVYDPLFDSEKLRHVLVRHEQGAGHAASGYAHATGKVGVMMATSGPGATNLVTPLADAQMDSIPVVTITPDSGCLMCILPHLPLQVTVALPAISAHMSFDGTTLASMSLMPR